MRRVIVAVIGALPFVSPMAVCAQETLRTVLPAVAISAVEKSDLDRRLTSSGYGSSPTAFVVAYYFVDEMSTGLLGPLHIGRFDHRARGWKTVMPPSERLGGSVNGVEVTSTYALIDLHTNPSAGNGAVIALDTLKLVAEMWGSPLAVFQDRTMLFIPGVVHFSPVHQYGVKIRNLATGADIDVFPQVTSARPLTEFKQRIDNEYARWSKERLDALKSYAYGTGEGKEALADLYTVVVCQRRDETWSCDEQRLEERTRATGIRLAPNDNGSYERDSFTPLLRRLLLSNGGRTSRAR